MTSSKRCHTMYILKRKCTDFGWWGGGELGMMRQINSCRFCSCSEMGSEDYNQQHMFLFFSFLFGGGGGGEGRTSSFILS